MIDSFHSTGNYSLFQIDLIDLVISERNIIPPCFNQTRRFVSFQLLNNYLNLKGT